MPSSVCPSVQWSAFQPIVCMCLCLQHVIHPTCIIFLFSDSVFLGWHNDLSLNLTSSPKMILPIQWSNFSISVFVFKISSRTHAFCFLFFFKVSSCTHAFIFIFFVFKKICIPSKCQNFQKFPSCAKNCLKISESTPHHSSQN